jgi:hypothetical protein
MRFEVTIEDGKFTEACKLLEEAQRMLRTKYSIYYELKAKSPVGATGPGLIFFKDVPREAVPALKEHFKSVIKEIIAPRK